MRGKLQWRQNPLKNHYKKRASLLENSKPVGFGKKFKWSDLPKIDDDKIFELFTKNLDWEVPAPVQHLIEKLQSLCIILISILDLII